jgi:hypothetical protein
MPALFIVAIRSITENVHYPRFLLLNRTNDIAVSTHETNQQRSPLNFHYFLKQYGNCTLFLQAKSKYYDTDTMLLILVAIVRN